MKVWQRIEKVKKELRLLKDKWTWSDSNLRLAAIGIPQNLITNILLNGRYDSIVQKQNTATVCTAENEDDFDEPENVLFDHEDLEPSGLTLTILLFNLIHHF